MSVQDGKGLNRQLQAAITRKHNHPAISASLLGRDGSPNRSSDGVADAAPDSLRPLAASFRQFGRHRAKLRGSRLGDDQVARADIRGEALRPMSECWSATRGELAGHLPARTMLV